MEVSRPGPVIGVCIVWAAFTGYAFLTFLQADLSGFPGWFTGYYTLVTAVALLGIIGILLMRKWGLFVFAAGLLLDQVMLLSQQQWHVFTLLLPMLVIMVAIAHLDDMR